MSGELHDQYVKELETHAKDMAGRMEDLAELVRTMPNWDEEPDEAWEHFDKLVESRISAERALFYYQKTMRKW